VITFCKSTLSLREPRRALDTYLDSNTPQHDHRLTQSLTTSFFADTPALSLSIAP
jgi:hypothetical protein